MSVVDILSRPRKTISKDHETELEENIKRIQREMQFKEKMETPEDVIFANAEKIVLKKGSCLFENEVALIGKDGKELRSVRMHDEDILNLFRTITKTYLADETELESIKKRISKDFYKETYGGSKK